MDPSPAAGVPLYGCYRHPDRPTPYGCRACGRPICAECAWRTPEGLLCPECLAAAAGAPPPPPPPADAVGAAPRPAGSGGPRRLRPRRAPVTVALIALNVLVWAVLNVGGALGASLVYVLSLEPTALCVTSTADSGGLTAAACRASGGVFYPGVAEGSYWQLLTHAFTHLDPLHIGFNMLALWFLGPALERFFGPARYLALYLGSALAGAAAVYWLADPTSTTLGASGAVFGLMGALLMVGWRVGGDVRQLMMWLVANLVFTFLGGPGISWQGHLGGLAGGLVLGWLLLRGDERAKGGGAAASGRGWLPLLAYLGVVAIAVAARSVLLAGA